MGGSGGGYFRSETPEAVSEALRKQEQTIEDQLFDTDVAKYIADLLSEYNNRDPATVQQALQRLKKALENETEEGTITPIFGGSVRKNTYVDGVSDVDSLFVLKGPEFAGLGPADALNLFEKKVRTVFPTSEADRDRMSLRVRLEGAVLEILPAVRRDGQLCIPTENGVSWSRINPEAFIRKLTQINDLCGKKVVPTIKIAKGINETFPENQRLSGYHIESLAIEAFKNYGGPQNTKAMIEYYFESSAQRVTNPIRDKTGQSLHVDEYAGGKNSETRKLMAQNLNRIARKMRNANATRSVEQWKEILTP